MFCGAYTVDFHWGGIPITSKVGMQILLSELMGILAENGQNAPEDGDSHGEDYTYSGLQWRLDEVYATTKLRGIG